MSEVLGGQAMRKLKMARRGIVLGVVVGLFAMLSGDPRAQTSGAVGIDPLEVLQVQVKNNVLFVFDTSGSMKWVVDFDNINLGGDSIDSRFYKGKQAIAAVVRANRTRMNFGLATYNLLPTQKTINRDQDYDGNGKQDGPFVYVSADANAAPFYVDTFCPATGDTRDGFFCNATDTFTNYDGGDATDIYRSFSNRRGTEPAGGIHDPYPIGCTTVNDHSGTTVANTDCRYYLHSKIFRGNVRYTWNMASNDETTRLVSQTTATCPNPPAGLVGFNPNVLPDADGDGLGDDGLADNPVPCIEMVNQATGAISRFYYSSAIFQLDSSSSSCGGATILTNVAFCDADNGGLVLDWMRAEIPVTDTMNLSGIGPATTVNGTGVNYAGIDPTPFWGVRADQSTPIAGSLQNIRTAATPAFPIKPAAVSRIQKNFVVFITDGDDTCASAGDLDGDGNSNTLDDRALAAAHEASRLFYQGCGPGVNAGDLACVLDGNSTDPRHQAETFFIAFASAVNIDRSNQIALAGSGALFNNATRKYDRCNTTTSGASRTVCGRLAFTAQTTEQLIAALEEAMQAATAGGEFAAARGILGTVFEFGDIAGDPSPLNRYPLLATDPLKRYDVRVNLFYQPTFRFPKWEGHLYAYRNDGTFQRIVSGLNHTGNWDAGETLYEQISENDLGIGPVVAGVNSSARWTFTQLTTQLRRRVFTSAGNGSWTRATLADFNQRSNQNVVSLWPPNATTLAAGVDVTGAFGGGIDPAVPAIGPLDVAMGLTSMTVLEMQQQLHACEATSTGAAPPDCDTATGDTSTNPTLAYNTARREARRILLAWIAGARVALTNGKAERNAGNELLFVARGDPTTPTSGSLLLDTTLAVPAIVTPPLRAVPTQHTSEFIVFRDGLRGVTRSGSLSASEARDAFDRGFGLRNPDTNNPDDPSGTATRFNRELKPRLTVIYVGAADGLHAFSAETSEELWTFVPWDQLGKLKSLAINNGQAHSPHTYMVSSSVRVADIFIPTPSYRLATTPGAIDYQGVWRTVAFFGRGPGGKYYTALDITSPAPFTISRGGGQLDTIVARQVLATNPPWVMWNRGNPDIRIDGNPVNAPDTAAYGKMGESWSVPAVGNIDPTAPDASGNALGLPEWRAYVGSGYGNAGEGSTFYELDAITGNVLRFWDVGNGNTMWIPRNALVASPAGYNSFQLDPPNATTRGNDVLTRLYIPDVHGRIWKFTSTSGGIFANQANGITPLDAEQPFGDPVALLKINNLPYVFASAGHDNRVRPMPSPLPPFKVFGFRDNEVSDAKCPPPCGGTFVTGTGDLATKIFEEPFVSGSEQFRSAGQPGTGFNSQGQGRVFFLGTRLDTATGNCLSQFHSILFALGAQTGVGVYDFDGATGADKSTIFRGERMMGPQVTGQQVMLSASGKIDNTGNQVPPTPPTPRGPLPRTSGETVAKVQVQSQAPSSTVCRFWY